jgi:hypothetical protein
MCPGQKDIEKRPYLRAIFDTIPLPTFIVDDDVRIQDYNAAAGFLLACIFHKSPKFSRPTRVCG